MPITQICDTFSAGVHRGAREARDAASDVDAEQQDAGV
jgi:hypothetical protein